MDSKIPAAGLRALLKMVDDNQLDITDVTCYLAINSKGHRTLVYVASKDGADILKYPKEEQSTGPVISPAYDFITELIGGGINTSNILQREIIFFSLFKIITNTMDTQSIIFSSVLFSKVSGNKKS